MLISEILRTKGGNVVCVSAGTRIAEATALLHKHRIGAVLVTDGGSVVGVLSERDIVLGLHTTGAAILDHDVRHCMSAPVVTIAPGDRMDHALEVMTTRRFRHLPVFEGSKLVGVISIGDLVKHKLEEAEREAAELKSYIAA